MNYDYVIDSYAWIEYFAGSHEGETAREYVEKKNSATPTIVVAELSRKLMREVSHGRETIEGRSARLSFLRSSTGIIDLTDEIATLAGEIDAERKQMARRWGLADPVVLATARVSNAKVVTGDKHFMDLKEIIFLS